MVPTSFDESNKVLDPPVGVTLDECDPLSVLTMKLESGKPIVISCWKLTREEVDLLVRTGRLWLTVMGETMPPVILSVQKPFKPENKDE